MVRKFIDFRDLSSEIKCTVAVFADNEVELLDAAVKLAVAINGYTDTPELRAQLKQATKIERRRAA